VQVLVELKVHESEAPGYQPWTRSQGAHACTYYGSPHECSLRPPASSAHRCYGSVGTNMPARLATDGVSRPPRHGLTAIALHLSAVPRLC
jgi:hypothetical protein